MKAILQERLPLYQWIAFLSLSGFSCVAGPLVFCRGGGISKKLSKRQRITMIAAQYHLSINRSKYHIRNIFKKKKFSGLIFFLSQPILNSEGGHFCCPAFLSLKRRNFLSLFWGSIFDQGVERPIKERCVKKMANEKNKNQSQNQSQNQGQQSNNQQQYNNQSGQNNSGSKNCGGKNSYQDESSNY